eukprot:CAMPEP_0194755154 /NCGR_PEP_ID=MMETSP0323_2-20130528/9041_1 /TAXON_ID=2866 ORGANISM="Crypthecodinium cohnii, Strain Seligo" /NCGR_SAMPLE_ID=MMETSP0323_2 /ASSEMBLY_ACC=CAM_ASM_000346 /LENGTH=67 /DNA_ID=CAMNT_0039674057 /DNA_START=207 /DNA_END=411 /DNA_ORIENTATION=+
MAGLGSVAALLTGARSASPPGYREELESTMKNRAEGPRGGLPPIARAYNFASYTAATTPAAALDPAA